MEKSQGAASLERLAGLCRQFNAYYAMGRKMANAYVAGGPETGKGFRL